MIVRRGGLGVGLAVRRAGATRVGVGTMVIMGIREARSTCPEARSDTVMLFRGELVSLER